MNLFTIKSYLFLSVEQNVTHLFLGKINVTFYYQLNKLIFLMSAISISFNFRVQCNFLFVCLMWNNFIYFLCRMVKVDLALAVKELIYLWKTFYHPIDHHY